MRVLLDTNIIIHRESTRVLHEDIGVLFHWLDKLGHAKLVHPVTQVEIERLRDPELLNLMLTKLQAYTLLRTVAPLHETVEAICAPLDLDENDIHDTALINEVFSNRVDLLITEDRKLHLKAEALDMPGRVLTIDEFIAAAVAADPGLAEYRVQSVRKEHFGNIDVSQPFFDSFRADYPGFDTWFNRKSDEVAYVVENDATLSAFLYVKLEGPEERYDDVQPPFQQGRRLKIGTFKATLTGHRIGERLLKIAFDNAMRYGVDEIYVTLFEHRTEQQRLVRLLEDFGFVRHGTKTTLAGTEYVYTRRMDRQFNREDPKLTYPFFSSRPAYLVPIYEEYHTALFPDSILDTESPDDFVEQEPFRNAIGKVYICRSIFRDLHPGDAIVFYRTGGYYKGVATTIGIVENIVTDIRDGQHLIDLCRKRSVFSDDELLRHWNYKPWSRPFVVSFLYAYSLPKRPNLARLIELGVIKDVNSVPRGFVAITREQLHSLLREAQANERLVVD